MKPPIWDQLDAVEAKLRQLEGAPTGGAVAWGLFAIALAIADHTDRREDCEATP